MQSYPIQAIHVTTSEHVPIQHNTTHLLHNNSACFTITSQVLLYALFYLTLYIILDFFYFDANVTWFILVKSGNAVANELFHVLHMNTHTCTQRTHFDSTSLSLSLSISRPSPFLVFNFNVTESHSQPNEMCCEMKTHSGKDHFAKLYCTVQQSAVQSAIEGIYLMECHMQL